jgi:hypothetical protein
MLMMLPFIAVLAAQQMHTRVSPMPGNPAEIIEIDGSKNPELIPEHLMWATAFDSIVLLHGKDMAGGGPLAMLDLAPADWKEVLDEAARHVRRRADCEEQAGRAAEMVPEQASGRIPDILRAETLKCREALLESKERLLARLTPDGRAALGIWVLNERQKIRAWMPRSELGFWRLPR